MKQIAAICLAAGLAVAPAQAGNDDLDEGVNLLEEGTKLLLRGLMEEMGPTMEELRGLADEMAPAMKQLQDMIGDITQYHAPEMLPNGDIIIRRKTPLEPAPDGEVEI